MEDVAFRSAKQVLATMEHVWIDFSIGHFQCKEDVAFRSAKQVLATMEHVWIDFSIGHFQCKEDVAFAQLTKRELAAK